MNTEPIIEIKGIGKRYDINRPKGGYVALRDILTDILKSPFSVLARKAKEAVGKGKKQDFWALRDINLEIKRGEVVGVIGANGAGKSTLLKILTGITPPTEGEIVMRGNVASLLEVGTGFHPELTGRENIYLNGAILGMRKKEISEKFNEIVTFAGIENFLDTPVKYYSSGMYVRLAFSVAAHMEPDILLVDEVLAVGDAEFQKKCLGKMEEVTKQGGRTILFVSHNLSAVQQLCGKSLLLAKGRVVAFGETGEIIKQYLKNAASGSYEQQEWRGEAGNHLVRMMHASISSQSGAMITSEAINIEMELEVLEPVQNLVCGFTLYSEYGHELAYVLYDDAESSPPPLLPVGKKKFSFQIPKDTLAQGSYRIEFDIGIHGVVRIVEGEGSLTFSLINQVGLGSRFPTAQMRGRASLFRPLWRRLD